MYLYNYIYIPISFVFSSYTILHPHYTSLYLFSAAVYPISYILSIFSSSLLVIASGSIYAWYHLVQIAEEKRNKTELGDKV